MSEELQQTKDDAPVKSDEGPKRFVEKGPHVIQDTQTGIFWLKKDSWQDKGKFFNWHESRDYSDNKNMRRIGGFDDWRLPSFEEAKTLFDASKENPGKGGVILRIDTIFPEGAFKVEWLAGDTSTRRPRFDFVEGKEVAVDEYSFGSVRLCRKDAIRKVASRPQRKK
ncbi:hypothetical protein UR09_00625 [Candidatus Nitromaritima sp. SCGC AAA799-A02]|nr:hypothetical protein UR09_00625 [Candidatus Nitromaritima sp. SCGC AAA799-A02]